jgi:signal transduction histidine kinase
VISDNGRGFDAKVKERRYGIRNMLSRTKDATVNFKKIKRESNITILS